mmetsp:Transcript_1126/g.3855  ORF Transcript_1126/g.3855 Transcript_1126/m.3855 type:complete len:547 (-) Transcript_1126:1569-3209(-)
MPAQLGTQSYCKRVRVLVTRGRRYEGLLQDKDPVVRLEAVRVFEALSGDSRAAHATTFGDCLKDGDISVRLGAVNAIEKLAIEERSAYAGPLSRVVSSDASADCRHRAAEVFVQLAPEGRSEHLESLASSVVSSSAKDRELIVQTFGRLDLDEQMVHNNTLLRFVLGRRRFSGDVFDQVMRQAGCIASQVQSAAALYDRTQSPTSFGRQEWSNVAGVCCELLAFEHVGVQATASVGEVQHDARCVLLKMCQMASHCLPSCFEGAWVECIQTGAGHVLERMAASIHHHVDAVSRERLLLRAVVIKPSAPHATKASLGLHGSSRSLRAAKSTAALALSTMKAMAALHAEYAHRQVGIDVLPDGSNCSEALLSKPGEIGEEYCRNLVNGGAAATPRVHRRMVVAGDLGSAMDKQEDIVNMVLAMAQGSNVVSVQSNLTESSATDLLATTVSFRLLFGRPYWAPGLIGVRQDAAQTMCCGFFGRSRTMTATSHEHLTFGDMVADPSFNDMAATAIRKHRLRARDIQGARDLFKSVDLCNVPISAQLDLTL